MSTMHPAVAAAHADLLAAVDRYVAANDGVLPAGDQPGDLGRLFDVLVPTGTVEDITAVLDELTVDNRIGGDDIAPVIAATRAYLDAATSGPAPGR